MLETRQLQCFVAVAEARHFGRAAERMNLAQSALSQQIKRLEEELGTRLMTRGRRTAIALTEAGAFFLEEAKAALEQMARAEQVARRAARGEIGQLEVGYVLSAAMSGVLPTALQRFRGSRPDIEIRLKSAETAIQLRDLADGRLDFGFVRPRGNLPAGLVARTIHEESVVLGMAAHHPLAAEPCAPGDLAAETFLLPQSDADGGFEDLLAQLAAAGDFAPRLIRRAPDFLSVMSLAAAGYGIALLPEAFAAVQVGNLVRMEVAGLSLSTSLALVHRAGALSAAAVGFLEIVGRVDAGPGDGVQSGLGREYRFQSGDDPRL